MRIAIIGAGINGLYLAFKLSKDGHKVSVFERKKEIGNEACSGLFSQRILDFLPQSKELIKNRINYTLIHFPQKTIRVDFNKEFLVMDHAELDKVVFSLAKEAGAEIFLNYNINEIPQGFDKIIGCDGPLSFVRKTLGLKDPKYRLGILGFVRDPLPAGQAGASYNFVETWPVRQGFIWKIPRGENIEYGILAEPKEAKKLLGEFLKNNNIILEDLRAKIVPQGLIIPDNNSITLSGDSAGLTKPWSGGGVVWQLDLADILLKTFPDFKKYQREAKIKMGINFFISKIIVKLIYFFGFNFPWILPSKIKMDSDYLFCYNKKNEKHS